MLANKAQSTARVFQATAIGSQTTTKDIINSWSASRHFATCCLLEHCQKRRAHSLDAAIAGNPGATATLVHNSTWSLSGKMHCQDVITCTACTAVQNPRGYRQMQPCRLPPHRSPAAWRDGMQGSSSYIAGKDVHGIEAVYVTNTCIRDVH